MRAALIVLAMLPAAAAAQPVVTSVSPDKVAVTVYRDPGRGAHDAMNLEWLNGFALISERRRVQLPAGESVIRFEGVAAGIVPQTAIVSGFPGGIIERNRDAYLLSPATLLDRSLGERVHVRRTSAATGAVREQEAIVRSGANGAIVVQTADGIETLRCTGLSETLRYDRVPGGLSTRPTLSVRTRSAAAVDAVVTLSYLATGFDWQANYIAQLSDDGTRMDLFAWLTLASNDDTTFPDADTQAVAGRLNYTAARAEPAEGPPLQLSCWPQGTTSDLGMVGEDEFFAPPPPAPMIARETIVVTESRVGRGDITVSAAMVAQQEELGDLKLYRIPEPVTVEANAQKQVALLQRSGVRVETVYRSQLSFGNLERVQPARRFLVTRNRTAEGLGIPLPAGGVAVFVERAGRPLLIGEGTLGDRAIGDDVEIGFDDAPGVTSVTSLVGDSPGQINDYLLTVTNDQPRAVRYEAEFERIDGNVRFVPRGRLVERDGRPLWRVTVPANGSAVLRYRLETTN